MKFKILLSALLAFLSAASASAATVTANVAKDGIAYSNQPIWGGGLPRQLIDGAKNPQIHGEVNLTPGFAYTIDLGKDHPVSELKIYPRQDGCCAERLTNFRVSLHTDNAGVMGAEVWGTNLFPTGNAGSGAGMVVNIPLPSAQTGRWIEIRSLADPVPNYALQINEVEVYAAVQPTEVDRAFGAVATANQAVYVGTSAANLVDGNRFNQVHGIDVVQPGFAYDINLGVEVTMSKIDIFPRQDGCCPERLTNYRVSVHTNNNGQIGAKVWSADLHTDGSNPGSAFGTRETLTAEMDPTSTTFKGQWIRIESLDPAPTPYALQITEVEVYGTIPAAVTLILTSEPQDIGVGVGASGIFTVGLNAINADPALVVYQWQKNGVDIPGATSATYTTPAILSADSGSKYRVNISYPGVQTLTSREATLKVNYALGALASVNGPLWPPGGFNIQQIVDGNRGNFLHGDATLPTGFAYSMRLGGAVNFEAIDIFPRNNCCPDRVSNIRVAIHQDNAGGIGAEVWSVDLFTEPNTNAGATPVHVVASMDPDGTFQGRWIKITALADPVPSYALQIAEVEAFGTLQNTAPQLSILQISGTAFGAPGRSSTISLTGNVFNGIATNIIYQWRREGVAIAGATNRTYTTPILQASDLGAKYSVVLSYPGATDLISGDIAVVFDYNYARWGTAFANQKLWVGVPTWSIQQIVDGNIANFVHGDTALLAGYAYTINMGDEVTLTNINIYPRQDGCCPERVTNIRVSVHADNGGQIGNQVWAVDLFPDTSAGSGPGVVVNITPDMDPVGTFKGQWIKIMSLAEPPTDYALQIGEVEAIGSIAARPLLTWSLANGLTLTWSDGTLESSTDLVTWGTVTGVDSPLIVPRTGPGAFYRVKK